MALIHIKHKNLADGVLLDEREFDASKHEKFGAKASNKKAATDAGDEHGRFLDASALNVIESLDNVSDDDVLRGLLAAESAGKARKTVLAAIETRLAGNKTPSDQA